MKKIRPTSHKLLDYRLGRRELIGLTLILAVILLILYRSRPADTSTRTTRLLPTEIAHAGGGIAGLSYTNSLNALNHSYDLGFRYFEVDLNTTTDDQIVILHDWGPTVHYLFGVAPGQRSYYDFMHLTMRGGLRQLNLAGLYTWTMSHPDSYVVLHIKTNVPELLVRVAVAYPRARRHWLPYVYAQQFQEAKDLGFTEPFLYVDAHLPSDDAVLSIARDNHPFAVAMPAGRATGELPRRLKAENVATYAWTVDSADLRGRLIRNDVAGILTNFLPPTDPTVRAIQHIDAGTGH
jgi:glycerophosphoryl diester phosphodiesterase